MVARGLLKRLWLLGIVSAAASHAAAECLPEEFSVEPQGVYELRLATGQAPDGATARLVFLDARGEDVAQVEASLGFARSGGVAALPPDGGETVIVSAAGNGTVKAVRARVAIDGADAAIVRSCSIAPFSSCEDPSHVSGFDFSATGEGAFADNLIANPSFEEDGGWRWLGGAKGSSAFRFSSDCYTGMRAAALDPATDGEGALASDIFPIVSGAPLHYSYAVRYSRHAIPHGHANPVRIEFLAWGGGGALRLIATDGREFKTRHYGGMAGEWMLVRVADVRIPAGATHARVIVEHRDTAHIWSGEATAGWGTILVDDISVWQGDGPPPQLPAGRMRDNSVTAAQDASRDGAMFFDGDAPALTLRLENLLGWNRRLALRGFVADLDGNRIGDPFEREFSLVPFAVATLDFALHDPPRHGAYHVDCEIVEPLAGTVCRISCPFVRISHPSRASAADKASGCYPFDMHPTAIDFNCSGDPARWEFEAAMMERMGVRGVRLQARYARFGLSRGSWGDPPERLDEIAARAAENYRANVKPVLDRHGLRGWVSLMEQERANPAGAVKTSEQFDSWERFHRSFAKALESDVDFVLFGNEGVGGYTAHLGDGDNLFPFSGFTGTTHDWMALAFRAVRGMKDGNPALPAGISHANDPGAAISRRFLKYAKEFGGAPVDCWGCNSYNGPHINAPAICGAFDEAGAGLGFFVIPELGERASTPIEEKAAAHAMVRQYAQTLAREPKTRHITWFAFSYNVFGAFSSSSGGGARATAAAYAVMTDTLRAGRPEPETPLTGGAFITWRRLDGTSVAVAWSAAGEKTVFVVPDGGRLVKSDIFGNIDEYTPVNGCVEVEIGPVAYYWVGDHAPEFALGYVPVDAERARRERIRAAMAAAKAVGAENLVRNAGFDGDGTSLPPEWRGEAIPGAAGVRLADCRFTREEGAGPNGETAILIDNREKDQLKSGAHPVVFQEVPVEEGAAYAFSVMYRKVRYGQWIQPQIDLLDSRGKVVRKLPTPETEDKEDGWALREVAFTVRKGEKTAHILLKGNHGGAGADYFACPELRKID